MYKRQYTDKTLTLWKIFVYNMRASELRKCWHFYIIKVLFLSIWMGRNHHLQLNILKHSISMIFCGEQSIYTRAILVNQKICMHDFVLVMGGGTCWGGVPRFCRGHVPPPPPRSYAPDWQATKLLFWEIHFALWWSVQSLFAASEKFCNYKCDWQMHLTNTFKAKV